MRKSLSPVLLFALLLMPALLAPAEELRKQDNAAVEEAFDALYRFQFQKARAIIDRHIELHPQDPLGYSVKASIALFQELDRLSILEGEFFRDDDKIKDKKKLRPDPALRVEIFAAVEKAQRLSHVDLARDPGDANALFCMSVTEGIRMDYSALIEKRHASSLKYAREAQSYAVKLLKVDPEFYDIYCTTGFSEYLLGSIPFFLRWFIKFEDTEGNKEEGLRKLTIAATRGKYFKPFAKLLLAIFYLRQKQPEMSERYLAQFEALYPENPLVRKERKKLSELLASNRAREEMAK